MATRCVGAAALTLVASSLTGCCDEFCQSQQRQAAADKAAEDKAIDNMAKNMAHELVHRWDYKSDR